MYWVGHSQIWVVRITGGILQRFPEIHPQRFCVTGDEKSSQMILIIQV